MGGRGDERDGDDAARAHPDDPVAEQGRGTPGDDVDPEAVHQARVASRRLREVLPIVLAPGGRTERLRRTVRRLTRTLGPVRELDVVRRAVSQGVVSYLLKPFTFAGLRAKLEQYAEYHARLSASGQDVVQGEIDQLLGALRTSDDSAGLPKGMSPETLSLVTSHLRGAGAALSASEVASQCGLSRVTARRYLEHLEGTGVLERRPRYGGTGRPEVEYRWR